MHGRSINIKNTIETIDKTGKTIIASKKYDVMKGVFGKNRATKSAQTEISG
jgi:hypothetical protein